MAWTQDLAGAYRQFPVRRPDDRYVAILTPRGVYLFRHHALAFGAVASVWGFSRCGDALAFLAQRALFCTVGHYVDDFIGMEASATVRSSFESFFTAMFRTLGLRMKEAKAAPPAREQKILTTSMFGHLGRAALVPIYSRSHGLQEADSAETLNTGLRDGIAALISILEELTPRTIPFTSDAPTTCIYTDAFFQMGDTAMKPHSCPVRQWFSTKAPTYVNGWGLVLRLGGQAVFAYGRVPPRIIQKFCSRKAYIYFLEIVTQIIALSYFRDHLPNLVVSFIDNQPGKHALLKGFGRETAVNNLLTMVWRLITHFRWHVSFDWVRSSCNIADGVSRHDLDDMRQINAVEAKLDMNQFWKILERVANDAHFAHHGSLEAILQLPPIALPDWWEVASAESRVHWADSPEGYDQHGKKC